MKILTITDKPGSAIDRLASMNTARLPHLNITQVSLHPKRPEAEQIEKIRKELKEGVDLIDAQYWKSAMKMRELFPETREIPTILTHHNEHNVVGEWEWEKEKWDHIVVKNGWQKKQLEMKGLKPTLIRHACEFKNLRFIPELTKEKIVLYVGQIKKVKGVRELAQACRELGYRLMVVGGVSEAGYYVEMDKTGIIFAQSVPDNEIGDVYHRARVYCANSDDGTESGTMPILEAMASGIPVVTRKIGLTRDCGKHGVNMFFREGKYTDIEDMKAALKMVMENDDISNELRENAWRTVRQYHPDVQAREYDILFRRVLFKDTIVSVIIPTYNRAEILVQAIHKLKEQTYKNFEVVICDDGSQDETAYSVVYEMQKKYAFPVRYINTLNTSDPRIYGLAKARNMGIIEAIGDIVLFCDDRLEMHPDAIRSFVKALQQHESKKVWVWGSKGAFKSFVENFSATWRRSLIDGGMFNERIDRYGGMTQEISARFASQGFKFEYVPQALCTPLITTHSKSKHREDIIASKIKLYKMGLQ
jgi:glycosyltransferase involved in cell wall biosynthesis